MKPNDEPCCEWCRLSEKEVRAIRTYDALVKALEEARVALDYTTADLGDDVTTANAKVKIDTALAAAKGDTNGTE